MKQSSTAATALRSVPPLSVGALLAALAVACTSKTPAPTPAPPVACDDAQCLPGNVCVRGYESAADEAAHAEDRRTLKCRPICDVDPSVDPGSAQDKCPANYHCAAGGLLPDGVNTASYCVPDRVTYPPSDKGQWGAQCNPSLGVDTNPACDTASGFWCYASAPNDGNAICTQFLCKDDLDCRGGYWCATVNRAPNAIAAGRSFRETTSVCLPRAWSVWRGSYCAPCATDVDCPLNGGRRQHCVSADGKAGAEKICAVGCAGKLGDEACNLDAACGAAEGSDEKVCLPRAGTCKGNGDFCSPCRSDTDCADGFCVTGQYTTERFCTKRSTTRCDVANHTFGVGRLEGCPAKQPKGRGVACYATLAPCYTDYPQSLSDGPEARALLCAGSEQLQDQCVGLVDFGTPPTPETGCWTPAH